MSLEKSNWVDIILKQKLVVYLFALIVCLAGLFSLFSMTISPFPAATLNKIFISISYPGANAETVNKQVTEEVVQNLSAINNIQTITAQTQAGQTQIELTLNEASKEKILQAQLDINQAIQSAHLPNSVSQPIIQVARGQSGLIEYIITSKKHNLFEIYNFINATIKPIFSALPGVVLYTGNLNPAINIALNPEKMAKYSLNPISVSQLIDQNYQSSPLGSLYVSNQDYILNAADNINSISGFKHLIVGFEKDSNKDNFGEPIFLNQIADVSFSPQVSASEPYATLNGVLGAYVNLNTQTNANPFKIKEATDQFMQKLRQKVGNEYQITETFNMASMMKVAMNEVVFTILIACILVILVALFFWVD